MLFFLWIYDKKVLVIISPDTFLFIIFMLHALYFNLYFMSSELLGAHIFI